MELETPAECEVEFQPTDADLEIVRQVRNLCPPPEVALQVIELARDPNVDIKRLSRLVELDPTLTAQLLRTVNSARFGLSARVSSVAGAVSLLGLKSLRMLATAFGLLNPFARLPHGLYQQYWRKSLAVALVARELVVTSPDDACVAFTSGLVSDIGVLVLAQVDATAYPKVYQQFHARPVELIAAENTRFGTNHVRVGGLLLREFGIEAQIVQAVLSLNGCSSRPSGDTSQLTKVLSVSQDLSGLIAQGNRDQWEGIRERLLREFHVDTDRLVDIMARVAAELHEWGKQFDLSIPQIDEIRFREIAAAVLADLSIAGAIDLSIFESVFGPEER